jgi:transposase
MSVGVPVAGHLRAEPRSKALFVFVGKRGHTMKVLTWDGTGAIVVHKKLGAGKFEPTVGSPMSIPKRNWVAAHPLVAHGHAH